MTTLDIPTISITSLTSQALGELPDVDGFLVGGASLKPTFTERRLLLKRRETVVFRLVTQFFFSPSKLWCLDVLGWKLGGVWRWWG